MTAPHPSPALPPTERLYWSRPHDRAFTATATAVQGQRVALDRTLFYPEGGGQPGDTGTLTWPGAAVAVTDVQKDDGSGVIWHTLDGQLPEVGAPVGAELDWTRRYRHSQRHTAEHLLAQAFWRVSPAFAVRSVSMRGPECTLDLAGQPGESHVQAAQALLAGMLREGLDLDTVLVDAGGLDAYPLRRPPQVTGTVRVVLFRTAGGEIWEASACGGTHLERGVQAAPVVVLRTERVKGDLTRIVFMAGEEATERLTAVFAQAQSLARGFSVGVERLPSRVADLQAELDSTEARLRTVRQTLAAELLDHSDWLDLPGGHLALIELPADLPSLEGGELIPPLLERAAARPRCVVAVLGGDGSCGVTSSLKAYSARDLLREWLAVAGGRGGGRPELARGQTERPQEFRAAVLAWRNTLS